MTRILLAFMIVAMVGCERIDQDNSCADACSHSYERCERCFYGGISAEEYQKRAWLNFIEECKRTNAFGCPESNLEEK